ncbi:MAG: hypothetical protein ACFCU9_07395 [Cyanophyceae cyanobacterium]
MTRIPLALEWELAADCFQQVLIPLVWAELGSQYLTDEMAQSAAELGALGLQPSVLEVKDLVLGRGSLILRVD